VRGSGAPARSRERAALLRPISACQTRSLKCSVDALQTPVPSLIRTSFSVPSLSRQSKRGSPRCCLRQNVRDHSLREDPSDAGGSACRYHPFQRRSLQLSLGFWATGLLVQPYSTHSRREYQEHAQLLFQAAVAHDSVNLRHAAAPEVVVMLLRAAENSPGVLQAWSRNAKPHHDVQVGDTTFVWFTVPEAACSKRPLTMAFVRPAVGLRTIRVFNTCGI
jgi:hypothetical protein